MIAATETSCCFQQKYREAKLEKTDDLKREISKNLFVVSKQTSLCLRWSLKLLSAGQFGF